MQPQSTVKSKQLPGFILAAVVGLITIYNFACNNPNETQNQKYPQTKTVDWMTWKIRFKPNTPNDTILLCKEESFGIVNHYLDSIGTAMGKTFSPDINWNAGDSPHIYLMHVNFSYNLQSLSDTIQSPPPCSKPGPKTKSAADTEIDCPLQ